MSDKLITVKPYTLAGTREMEDADQMFGILFNNMAKLKAAVGLTGDDDDTDTGINVTEWLKGPWTLDKVKPTDNIAVIRQDPVSGTTYDDFAPEGIDTAVAIELEPTGNITITGIKQYARIRRLLGIINRDSSAQITLTDEGAGSIARYRFDLPDNLSVVIGPKQAAWMYYNIGSERWQLFITPHVSGGLASSASTFGTASVTLTHTQMQSLNTSPVQIKAAESGKIIVPFHWTMQQEMGATIFSAAPVVTPAYAGSSTALCASLSVSNVANRNQTQHDIGSAFSGGAGTSYSNTAVNIRSSADRTDGSGTFTFSIAYHLIDSVF